MDLNSSSDEEEDAPVAAPPSSPPEQATIDQAGGATTNESMSVDESNEQVPEVEVEAVWEEEDSEAELDPDTLGVPGLKTLVPRDRIEVLWAHGWEKGRVKECALEMQLGGPVITYRITYDDGEEVVEDLRTLGTRKICDVMPEEDVQCVQQWERLELSCCISLQRLTNPAKGVGCSHRARCNYAHLVAYAAQQQRCPVFGCDSHLSRKRSIVRDESLRAALASAAPTPQHQWAWVRGDEVRLSPPDDDDARVDPNSQARSSATARMSKRQRLEAASVDSLAAPSAGKRRASGQQGSHTSAAATAAAKKPRSSSSGVGIKVEPEDMVHGADCQAAEGLSEEEEDPLEQSECRQTATAVEAAVCYARYMQQKYAVEAHASESDEEVEEAEQLWVQCDSCAKWRRLPGSMRDSDDLDEVWTCAMHPDPARRGCEVAEEGLEEDEVTTQVEVEQGMCRTPGCKYAEFHFGPCSCWEAAKEGECKKRQRSLLGKGLASSTASAKKAMIQAADTATNAPASTFEAPVAKPKARPVARATTTPTPRLEKQLWVQCDACAKWRRLPESMRDSDELEDAWTCAMHPDAAGRGCEVAEEGLGENEVTIQAAEDEHCARPVQLSLRIKQTGVVRVELLRDSSKTKTVPHAAATAGSSTPNDDVRVSHDRLPDEAKAILTEWCRDNIDHSYPNDHEKSELCAATHLTLLQVNNWFSNWRKRFWKAGKSRKDEHCGPSVQLNLRVAEGGIVHVELLQDTSKAGKEQVQRKNASRKAKAAGRAKAAAAAEAAAAAAAAAAAVKAAAKVAAEAKKKSRERMAAQNSAAAEAPGTRHKSSQYRGVGIRESGRWTARIKHNGKDIVIGRFDTEVAAALAHDEEARRRHGARARVNFPRGSPEAGKVDAPEVGGSAQD